MYKDGLLYLKEMRRAMKKIALIMDGWKRYFTYAWPAGILQRIRETGEEINLYIFNSSGDWSRDKEYNTGEYNIYTLPNFNDFDGIIMDVNNIRYTDISRHVIEEVKKSGKPAISVACEIEGMYYVGIDNYSAVSEQMRHLHEVHGCRKFWFVMGPAENYENQMRARAMMDYASLHGIEISQHDFYYDSFEYKTGYEGFQTLFERHQQLPEAIMCANDNIAVGVCEAAAKLGYHVPDDFKVTGFDNFDKASYYFPRISTVEHIREEVGIKCVDLLLGIWNGEAVPRFNFTKTENLYWDSCGCQSDIMIDHREYIKNSVLFDIETENFEEQLLELEYDLMNCKTVAEMSNWLIYCMPSMRCDAMYLVLDEHMNDFKNPNKEFDIHMIDDESFYISGYPSRMNIEFAYENGKVQELLTNSIESLFPLFESNHSGTDFLFLPIHFGNRTAGYIALRNATYLMEQQYLFKVLIVLTSAIENLHEREKLQYMNKVLADKNIRDAMTGLYNRKGYLSLGMDLYERKKDEGEDLTIMFLDLDRLKFINDHYGHEAGDQAICIVASAILKNCNKDAVPIRTGGDEFVIIQPPMTEAEVIVLIDKIKQDIVSACDEMGLPFEITFSAGAVHTDMQKDKSLDDYIRDADEVMYEEKAAKKLERGE